MGLVLVAPADIFAPLGEAPQAAPAQAAPDDGLFASLLASLSAAAESAGTLTGSTAEAPEPLAEPATDADSTDQTDPGPFAALMALSVTMPIAQPQIEQSHPNWSVSQDGGDIDGVHLRSSGVEVNHELSEEIATAPAAKPAIATEATAGAPAEGAATDGATQPLANATLVPGIATEASTSERAPATQRVEATTDANPPETAAAGDASAAAETPGVVRSVGNAESNETASGGDNGNSNNGKEAAQRGIPRASTQTIAHASDASAVAQLRTPETAPADPVAPLPADAAPATDVPPQVEQVAQTVVDSVEVGRGEARIHLDPAGLGEVTIHVRTEHDHVRVEIHAERHEAMQLLKDHTQDLSNLLGQRGLNLSDVNVGLGRGNGEQAWGRDENLNRTNSGNEFASILGIDEPAALDTHNRLRAAYNPDGALVYRV